MPFFAYTNFEGKIITKIIQQHQHTEFAIYGTPRDYLRLKTNYIITLRNPSQVNMHK